jgi:alcohol dehydrogenase
MEYNLVARPDRFARIAAAMGQPLDGLDTMQAAYTSVEAVRQIARHCDIPGMTAVGVKTDDFEAICQRILDDPGPPCNPRKVTREGLLGILEKMERNG